MLRLKIILQSSKIFILVLLFSILLSFIRMNFRTINDENINSLTGTLIDKKIDDEKVTFVIKNKDKIKCTYYLKRNEELKYYERLDNGIKIKVVGSINEVKNNTIPNTFNYKKYLINNNIKYNLTVDNIKIIDKNISFSFVIKNNLEKYINTFKTKAYLNTFIIGNKSYLNDNVYQEYQQLGVSHIFAISGMHVSLLSVILLFLLKKLKESYRYLIVIAFLLFYIFITNFSPSIIRSVVLFMFLYFNKKFHLELSTLNIYYFSISMILFMYPYFIYNIGFLYSSIISYALIKYKDLIKGNYIKRCFIISLIAFFFSLPITINTSYEVNILSVINNLFFVPLISFLIYPLSLLTLVIRQLDPILFFLTDNLEKILKYFLVLKISIPKLNFIIIIVYYVLLFIFFESFNKVYLFFCLLLLVTWKTLPLIDNNYYIYYLDVSQGDSIIIKNRGTTIMIDTGGMIDYGNKNGGETKKYYLTDNTILFLKSIGVNKIDLLFISHGDFDHCGESRRLIDNFKVKEVIFNNGPYNDLEKNVIEELKEKNIKYSNILDHNLKYLYVKSLDTNIYNNENDNSRVLYFNIYNYKFLFMGDAGLNKEKDILLKYNLTNIDFIKIGHHGSNTSSDKTFINNIKPKNCIISVGKNNRYNHPKESVLDILDDYCDIYRTDLDGSIEIKINNKGYKIKTYNP